MATWVGSPPTAGGFRGTPPPADFGNGDLPSNFRPSGRGFFGRSILTVTAADVAASFHQPGAPLPTTSQTSTAAGGAPGADFGPAGVAGAPTLNALPGAGLGILPIAVIALVGGFVAWKVLA